MADRSATTSSRIVSWSLPDSSYSAGLRPVRVPGLMSGSPRTLARLHPELTAPEVRPEEDVFDRIGEIVASDTNVKSEDAGWEPSVPINGSPRRCRR